MGLTSGCFWAKSESQQNLAEVRFAPQQRTLLRSLVRSALCRFCCKSRKSNDPENLAKGDFQRAVTLRSVVTPLRSSVVVSEERLGPPHVVACNTRQRARKLSFVTPKRLLQQNLPGTD